MQNAGIAFTQWFISAYVGAIHCSMNVKFGTGLAVTSHEPCSTFVTVERTLGPLHHAQFHVYWGQKCGNTAPETVEKWNFVHRFAPEGRLV